MEKFDLTYLTTDSIQEGVGSSQVVPLLKIFAELKMKVKLISYEKEMASFDLIDEISRCGISWEPMEFRSQSFLDPIYRYRELSDSIPDTKIIHGRSDIPTAAAVRKGSAPVLWDVRSLWSDQRKFVETSLYRKIAASSFRFFEQKSAEGASALSTLTRNVLPVLDDRYPSLSTIRGVVPTCTDLELFVPGIKPKNSIKGLFSGTYNKYYDLDLSRKFVECLRSKTSLDVTWARPKESLQTQLNSGEDNVISVSQNEMASLIPQYNFGIAICKMDAGVSLKASVPTKIGEFLACGIPVVVNKGLGDCDSFVEQRAVGVVLGKSQSLESKAEELMGLLSDSETSSRCRAVAEEYFDIRNGAKIYQDLYTQMLDPKLD